MRTCVRACVRACVCACVHACLCTCKVYFVNWRCISTLIIVTAVPLAPTIDPTSDCQSLADLCKYGRDSLIPRRYGVQWGTKLSTFYYAQVCYLGACVADTFPRTTAIETQRRPRPQDRQPERPPVAVTRRPAIPRRTYAPIVRTTQQVYRPTTVAPAPVPTSPRWGKWGFHGGCSRTCGGGIQFHVRRCLIGR